MNEQKSNEVRWAEKKIGRALDVHRSGHTRYVTLSSAELDKLGAGPSPLRLLAFALAGFAAARLLVWLTGYLGS